MGKSPANLTRMLAPLVAALLLARAGQARSIPTVPGSESLALERIVVMVKASAGGSTSSDNGITWDGNRGEFDDGVLQALTEVLRQRGWAARGYENVVFGEDKREEARYLLGGTLTRLEPRVISTGGRGLGVTIEWQLLDRRARKVVVKSVHPGVARGKRLGEGPMAIDLLADSLGAFLATSEVAALLVAERPEDTATAPHVGPMRLTCARGLTATLPKGLPKTMAAVVTIRAGSSLGSGVILASDGYVLTAAHVIDGGAEISVTLEAGTTLPATVVRRVVDQDVALLRIPGTGYPSLRLASDAAPKVGTDVWVLGAPRGLSSSASRGIVSGVRSLQDISAIQTDASINGGNSGGPMLDATGAVLGVVSFKSVGDSVEGLGFAISAATVRKALSLECTKAASSEGDAPTGKSGTSTSAPSSPAEPLLASIPPIVRKVEVAVPLALGETAPALRSWSGKPVAVYTGTGRTEGTLRLCDDLGLTLQKADGTRERFEYEALTSVVMIVNPDEVVPGGVAALVDSDFVAVPAAELLEWARRSPGGLVVLTLTPEMSDRLAEAKLFAADTWRGHVLGIRAEQLVFISDKAGLIMLSPSDVASARVNKR